MSKLTTKIKNALLKTGTVTVIGLTGYSYFISDTVETLITDAQMSKVDQQYMIATDYRSFKNTDAWYRLKFNSGKVQNTSVKLKGKKVQITKYGWRNPVFSMYENVVGIKEIK